ncbi:conserved hypothetical protein [Candidatus Methylacidithermus pantelleriae]|uniref:Uncharacterized protein n=1 Tax=Candidatus Methylacidithermus pantelleriae TaxID=2744239 RepID=A0A8J2BL34_9BACT|nr:conserved hypothetical protein [Candidatus Methylacidithermus pantelleriae]
MGELAEAQRRIEEQLADLVEAHRQLERRVGTLEDRVGSLLGSDLERRYRERAYSFFQRILKRISVMDPGELQDVLGDAVAAGRITEEEAGDVLNADVIAQGRRDGESTYLVVEVSREVENYDVERAVRRAGLLHRATGVSVLAVVAGEEIKGEADAQARAQGVWRVLDGVVFPP